MKPIALAAALFLGLTPAGQASPLDGRWAFDRADCAIASGASDMMPREIKGDRIVSYGSLCTMQSLVPIGTAGMVWRVKLTCHDEGEDADEKTKENTIFALHNDSNGRPLMLIEIDLDDGSVTGLYPCG
jgi:hypothetical protein